MWADAGMYEPGGNLRAEVAKWNLELESDYFKAYWSSGSKKFRTS
jgi:hypothetical protein